MKKSESKLIIPLERIERVIYIIRGIKVLLDWDLALLYGVETRVLIQAVKRNIERFPEDFMFQLTKDELENWRSQFVTSNSTCLKSQFVMSKGRGGRRTLPYAFTEQGVAMLSSVLRSPQAISINIEIMRAFICIRQALVGHKEMSKELTELRSFLLKHSNQTSREFKRVWDAIEKLAKPANDKQRKIGFDLN